VKRRLEPAAIGTILTCALSCISTPLFFAQNTARVEKNVVVYSDAGHFAGWPANHGAWSWGNEMLVGFEIRVRKKGTRETDHRKHVLGRSFDGGETWKIEEPESLRPPRGFDDGGPPVVTGIRELTDCAGGIDFTNRNFILTARMANDVTPGQSRFYYSLDRGKTWMGPYRIPNFGQTGTAARTDYLVNGKHDLTLFLTAAKSNGQEGRVICVRTRDGGKSWQLESFVGQEPQAPDEYAIMPSSVRLPGGRILTAIRYGTDKGDPGLRLGAIDLYSSDDDGKSWGLLSRPASAMGGNPPSMVLLKDGRLVVTYGYRRKPFGMRSRISKDGGNSWGEEIVLRADGGSTQLGYPRTLLRPDGKLVTLYYFTLHEGAEPFIAATIWEPGTSQ
jgi:hypothetical protein